MVCICNHDKHAWNEPTVCSDIFCNCEKYVEATQDNIVINQWDKYVEQMNSATKQIRWVLENIKYTRNLDNNHFVKFFRNKIRDN